MAKIYQQGSKTVLAYAGKANAVIAGSAESDGYTRLLGGLWADIPGNVRVEQSLDGGLHWDIADNHQAAAGVPLVFDLPLAGNAVKVSFSTTAPGTIRAYVNIVPL